ncbi:hypothetical protein AK812_SmicGene8837 [Symbiodinium microadriaticum]|uniref:Uncharacterized protein n=1 Tax=Symbiodinium microadriaticum TaxID=2951 RepID=A0A1Q9EK24_SYMMI|nr:hypothetical protein AK812_SmicGene8837 [Symbiodinium microadriaticum]
MASQLQTLPADLEAAFEELSAAEAEANGLFKEGRFRLARQRYFEITELFHHLDKPELKARCRKLRIECRLNIAACGIKLQEDAPAGDLGHGECVCMETPGQTGDAFPRVVASRDAMHAGTVPLSASEGPVLDLLNFRCEAKEACQLVLQQMPENTKARNYNGDYRHAAPVASWIAYGPKGRHPTVKEFQLLKKFMDKIDGMMLPSRLSDVLSDMQTVLRVLPRPANDAWVKAKHQLEKSLRKLRHRCKEAKTATLVVAPDDDIGDAELKAVPEEAQQVGEADDSATECTSALSNQHLTLFRKMNEWNFLDDAQKLECLQQAEVATRRPRRSLSQSELADIVNMAAACLAAPRRKATPQDADAECPSEATLAMESWGPKLDLQPRVRSLLLRALHVWRINQFDCHAIEHVLDVVHGKISKFEEQAGEVRSAAAGKAWLKIKQAVELMLRAGAPSSSTLQGEDFAAEAQVQAAQHLKPHRVKPRLERQSGIQNINWSVGRRCWACQYFSNKKGMKCKNTIRYFPIAKFLEEGLGDEAAVDAALQEAKAYREELVRQGKLKPPKPKVYPDSMVRGVYFSHCQQKWKVQLYHPIRRKVMHGGYFSSREKAEARARELASEFGVQPDIKVLPG